MQPHQLSHQDIILIKKAYRADTLMLGLIVFIFLFGIGTVALESYHGDIPKAALVSVVLSLIVALGLGWKLQQKMKKDIALGTFHVIEGFVNSSTRGSVKIGTDYYSFSYYLENPVKKGDKIRLYVTDATQMIFKLEKITEILPDVI
ncbi:MAG: hypothetical protein MUC49_01985 [Raineya sp.]|jgi:membrane protein implicated in regulation of membrane protease activity|nr:hypothetical protein [Raineya sp.]